MIGDIGGVIRQLGVLRSSSTRLRRVRATGGAPRQDLSAFSEDDSLRSRRSVERLRTSLAAEAILLAADGPAFWLIFPTLSRSAFFTFVRFVAGNG